MRIVHSALAGTLESSDIMIQLEEQADGIAIELTSSVMFQYGDQIRTVIKETLLEAGVEGVRVIVMDRGALDCTIRARVMTAVKRACALGEEEWRRVHGSN